MEFVGIIVAVSNLEEKAVSDSRQNINQCYRDVVVQTQEVFPKGICATLKGTLPASSPSRRAARYGFSSSPASTSRKPRANGSPRATHGELTHVKLTPNPLQ